MNKKQLVFGALLGLPTLANADVTFSIDDITIAKNETRTVTVNVDVTDESELSTFKMLVTLPNGLRFKHTDNVTTTTDYGWSLSRSNQDKEDPANPKVYQFFAYNKGSQATKLKPTNASHKVLFTFDVVALNTYAPKKSDKIIISEVQATDGDQPESTGFKVIGDITPGAGETVLGNINGIYRLNGTTKNFVSVNGGKTNDDFELTPKHEKTITVEFTNHSGKDIYGNWLGDDQVRSLEGFIYLPKGITIKDKGEIEGKRTERTNIEDFSFGEYDPVKDANGEVIGNLVKFTLYASSAPLKKCDDYGIEIFKFEVEADNDFKEKQAQIVMKDFIAGRFHDSKRYTLDDEIVITVNNPNEATKDDWDNNIIGKDTDPKTGTLWAQYNAAEAAVNDSVKAAEAIIAQETNAKQAIKTLNDEVNAQYAAGTLNEWDGKKEIGGEQVNLKAAAEAAIANIAVANNTEMVKARENAKKANDAVKADDPLIPTYLDQEAAVKAIKDQRDGGKGSLKNAKEALAKYEGETLQSGKLKDAIDAGTLSDADFTADIEAIDGQKNALTAAVTTAGEEKANNDDKANAIMDKALVPELPKKVENDPEGLYAAAKAVYDEKVEALKKAFGKDGTDGTVGEAGQAADKDVYQNWINAIADALGATLAYNPDAKKYVATDFKEEGIYGALKEINKKAEANHTAAEKALSAYYPPIPDNVRLDDAKENGTHTLALNVLIEAQNKLNEKIAYAEENGEAATAGVYDDEIKAIYAAIGVEDDPATEDVNEATGLYKAIQTLLQKAAEYEKLVNDALLAFKADEIPASISSNDAFTEEGEVKDIYDKAKAALEGAVAAAAAEGTQARPDVYKELIEKYQAATEALNNKITALTSVAEANENAAKTALDKNITEPAGTEKNDAYDNIKGSQAIQDKEKAVDDAKKALEEALNKAKDNDGSLGEDPNPLADEISAVEADLDALQQEANAQSVQAAENFDAKEKAIQDADVKQPENEDVLGAKTVQEALADIATAREKVELQYQDMLDANKTGDAAETEKLNAAIEEMNEKIAAYNDAVKNVEDVLENIIANMTENVEDLKDGFINTEDPESEINLARVANPNEDIQEEGKLDVNTDEVWKEKYDQLLKDLAGEADAVQTKLDEVKAAFLADEIDKDGVIKFQNETIGALAETANENVRKILVRYLLENQRGDLGGDGRLTTNDYALVRRMMLNESYPKAQWAKVDANGADITEGINVTEGGSSEDAYLLALYDINRDGVIGVGDAMAALNNAFYGNIQGPEQARDMANAPEALTARANGNVVAVALQSGRKYGMFMIDVMLSEGMTLTNVATSLRTEGFSVATSELSNGATRIMVSPAEPKAFQGTEGDLLYLELAGKGSVEFQQVVFADVNSREQKFQLEAVAAGEATGISGVNAENGVMQTIYNLGGRMMNGLKKGINIIRNANGETQKVIKK